MRGGAPDAEILRLLRSEEGWISAAEIEDVMVNGICTHGWPSIDICRTCFPAELTRRQVAHVARLIGCTTEDAAAIADTLVTRHIEGMRP